MGVQTSRYPPVEEAAVARDDMVAGHKSETQAAAPSLQGAATEMVKLQDGDDLANSPLRTQDVAGFLRF